MAICGYKGCLIADRDGVYDPATPNGRLLLGLKGTLSEMERQTIRARLTAGLLHKAERGDRALSLPIGLVRDQFGRCRRRPTWRGSPRRCRRSSRSSRTLRMRARSSMGGRKQGATLRRHSRRRTSHSHLQHGRSVFTTSTPHTFPGSHT